MENKINLVLNLVYEELLQYTKCETERNKYLNSKKTLGELFVFLYSKNPIETEQFLDYVLEKENCLWTSVGLLNTIKETQLKQLVNNYCKTKVAQKYIKEKNGQTKNT